MNDTREQIKTHQDYLSEDAKKCDAIRRKKIKNKIVFMIIDKLLLGGILGGIIAASISFVEYKFREAEKTKDMILSVSRINTEFISEQRRRLIHSMAHFTREFDNLYGIQNVNSDSIDSLKYEADEIRSSLSQIRILDDKATDPLGKDLLLQIDLVLEELPRRTISDDEIKEKIKLLNSEYKNTLEAVRSVSIHAVEQDRRAVLKHFD